jgi:hypothetical protein
MQKKKHYAVAIKNSKLIYFERYLIMFIPQIPNNSLTKEITDLVKVCQELDNDKTNNWVNSFYQPAKPEQITDWEMTNKTSLPESYKDFIAFSDGARVRTNLLNIYSLNDIVKSDINQYGDVYCIGDLIGDGERIYFTSTGDIKRGFFNNHDSTESGLNKILVDVIRMAADELPMNIKEDLYTLNTPEEKKLRSSLETADNFLMRLYMEQLKKSKEGNS